MIDRVKKCLIDNDIRLVIINGENIITSNKRGVKALLDLLDSKVDFSGSVVADRVVGKAAAMIYVLLGIKGIYASFTMFMENGAVNISARSFGEYNVQLIMEAIGGGGHLTMAGAQLKGISLAEAKEMLVHAIDRHQEDRDRSLAAAQGNIMQ